MNGTFKMAWGTRGIQVACVLLVGLLWFYIAHEKLVSPIFIPPLGRVLVDFSELVFSGRVFHDLFVTLSEMAVAWALAAIFGLSVGYAIGRSRLAVQVFEPLLAGIFAVPIVIFLPLFILLLGFGMESKMAFGATYAFFPIVLNTISGISQVNPQLITVSKSLGATDMQLFRRVLLPAALPVIATGMRIGFVIGFLAIIGNEMIAGYAGLGAKIVRLAEGMDTSRMFAYILVVILLAAILNFGLTAIQNRFSQVGRGA